MTVKHVCAATGCETAFSPPPGRGRLQIYCSPPCRPSKAPSRQRRHAVAVDIEPDDPSTTPATARSFTVVLRRGSDTVVVRSALGRFSAAVLAEDLTRLLALPAPPGIDTTD